MSRIAQDTAQLRTDAARITEVADGHLDSEVPGCPGWVLRDLVSHLGAVHRWATQAVATGRRPDRPVDADRPDDALLDWFSAGAVELADTLDAVDPEAPVWMPWDVERPVAAVWLRRQTHETSLHRRDAENAAGVPAPIAAPLAADGIDEYLALVVPRKVSRDGIEIPSASLHIHCTDDSLAAGQGEWFVSSVDGYAVTREHRKGDAALRGRAEDLLLALWGRPVPDGALDVVGDADVASAWLALGGT